MNPYAPTHPAPVWVGRFGAHLLQLRPSINVFHAIQRAVATWPYASHLEPEAAADILIERLRRDPRSH